MSPSLVSLIFCGLVSAGVLLKFWLASRQIRNVHHHRGAVPPAFATIIPLPAHQLAADYTITRTRFGMLRDAFGASVLIGWTLLGGLDALNQALLDTVLPRWGPLAYQVALFVAFSLISMALDLPFELWRVFRIEQQFGFNRMSLGLFWADQAKGLLVAAGVGLPLLGVVLWVMDASGSLWWLWVWAVLMGFSLLMQVVWPTWIAPLFNQFKPLEDAALAERVQALMDRCGFQSRGLYVMDGSRRSSHGNAYFAGLGRAKRVVFFDTVLARLAPSEIEAVLAHELGHFHHGHIRQQLARAAVIYLGGLALLAGLASQVGFYLGLGVSPNMGAPNDALALLLFLMTAPAAAFFLSPWMAHASRKAEFQADAYACNKSSGADLGAALLKLYEDNASTLTPDPVYARFYLSHPPAAERIPALAQAAQ